MGPQKLDRLRLDIAKSQSRQLRSSQRKQTTFKSYASKRAPPPPKPTDDKAEGETSFRWNPAQSRWERVKASRNNAEKYSLDRWQEGGVATIQTKSGTAYIVWPVIHAYLTDKKVKSVTVEEAYRLQQEEGAILVDPRVPWDYEKNRAKGAVSVPLFRGVAGKSAWDSAKRLIMAVGFAMKATERDPDFQKTAKAKLPTEKKLIVYCGLGGTLEVGAQPYKEGGKSFKDDPERMFGRESRSFKAIYELLQMGYTDVVHLKGGLSQWRYDGLPTEP